MAESHEESLHGVEWRGSETMDIPFSVEKAINNVFNVSLRMIMPV